MKRDYDNDGLINLAGAVLMQAINDYSRPIEFIKNDSARREAQRHKESAERFIFKSKLCDALSMCNRKYIQKIAEERRKERYAKKQTTKFKKAASIV